jgi:diguanylate cyclase (GGDEF)-like protein
LSARTLLTLVLPGAIATAAAAILLADAALARYAGGSYPVVACGVALFLAARFDRSRLFVLTFGVLATLLLLRSPWADRTATLQPLLATLLPLVCATLVTLRDAPIASRAALLQLSVVCISGALALVGNALWPEPSGEILAYEMIDPLYTSWSGLPQPALLLWALCVAVLIVVTVRRGRAAEAGVFWGASLTMVALAWQTPAGRDVWLLAAAAAVAVALVESSRALALHDELTGLPARRALNQTLAALRPPYAVAIVDVDHFKSFNDRHGHDVGDQVLRMVAARLERVRDGTAYRSGGEEFTVVFPGASRADARTRMEEVRAAIESATFTLRRAPRPRNAKGVPQRGRAGAGGQKLGVTVSVGIAVPTARANGIESVIRAADKAMYRAKKGGRNRVVA